MIATAPKLLWTLLAKCASGILPPPACTWGCTAAGAAFVSIQTTHWMYYISNVAWCIPGCHSCLMLLCAVGQPVAGMRPQALTPLHALATLHFIFLTSLDMSTVLHCASAAPWPAAAKVCS